MEEEATQRLHLGSVQAPEAPATVAQTASHCSGRQAYGMVTAYGKSEGADIFP